MNTYTCMHTKRIHTYTKKRHWVANRYEVVHTFCVLRRARLTWSCYFGLVFFFSQSTTNLSPYIHIHRGAAAAATAAAEEKKSIFLSSVPFFISCVWFLSSKIPTKRISIKTEKQKNFHNTGKFIDIGMCGVLYRVFFSIVCVCVCVCMRDCIPIKNNCALKKKELKFVINHHYLWFRSDFADDNFSGVFDTGEFGYSLFFFLLKWNYWLVFCVCVCDIYYCKI